MSEPLTLETIKASDIEALRNWAQLIGHEAHARIATEALTRYRDSGVKQPPAVEWRPG